MNKRQSIYVGKDLDDLVSDMLCQDKSQSGIINTIAARYSTIIARNMPELTQTEWLSLMRALVCYDTRSITQAVNGLAGTIADADINVGKDFANHINDLYFEEKLSIIHVSELFWAAGGNVNITDCGARIG